MVRELDPLDRLAEVLGALPRGVAADARLEALRFGTMRFANGRIHQPHLDRSSLLSLRVVESTRIGIATTTDVSSEGTAALIRTARALARVAPPDPKFPTFPADGERLPTIPYSLATARLTPEAHGRLAARALEGARSVLPDARISGAVNAGSEQLAVANTSGLARTARRAFAQASVLVERPDQEPPVSGWSEGAHWDATKLDTFALGREAAETVPARPPVALKPGKYRVVLGGAATAELLAFLGYLGFNVRGDEEGWGCLRGKRGKRVAPATVAISDEPTSRYGLPRAMDFEGIRKAPLALVERGIARGPVFDLRSAGRAARASTGHGPSPESPFGDFGPSPGQIHLAPGDASPEELAKTVRDGVLVTRFHYVRVVHPGQGMITGMTRDGTYRIRRGEVAEPVLNLRFTESVLTALRGIEAVGRQRRCYGSEQGGSSTTNGAIAVGGFRFTSATVF